MPPGNLFREPPDLLDILATQLARHAAKWDDEVLRIAAEYREKLLDECREPPADTSGAGDPKR